MSSVLQKAFGINFKSSKLLCHFLSFSCLVSGDVTPPQSHWRSPKSMADGTLHFHKDNFVSSPTGSWAAPFWKRQLASVCLTPAILREKRKIESKTIPDIFAKRIPQCSPRNIISRPARHIHSARLNIYSCGGKGVGGRRTQQESMHLKPGGIKPKRTQQRVMHTQWISERGKERDTTTCKIALLNMHPDLACWSKKNQNKVKTSFKQSVI